MSATIRRTSGIAFAVVAVLLLVISALGYRTIDRSAEANERVAHTYRVLNALERVLTSMVDAETGTRGFVNTGAIRYLEPFERANAELGPAINEAASLTADNPVQQQNVTELRARADATMRVLREMVARAQRRQAATIFSTFPQCSPRPPGERAP